MIVVFSWWGRDVTDILEVNGYVSCAFVFIRVLFVHAFHLFNVFFDGVEWHGGFGSVQQLLLVTCLLLSVVLLIVIKVRLVLFFSLFITFID